MIERQRASAPESAKILKATLRQAFPATTFSVRLSRGTGYGSVHVNWTDGPSTQAVDEVLAGFEGKGFDGMTDSTYYKETALPDGRASGLGYVMPSRHISAGFVRRLVAQIAAYYGVEPVAVVERGKYWELAEGFYPVSPGAGVDWNTAVHRAASDRTCYQREAP